MSALTAPTVRISPKEAARRLGIHPTHLRQQYLERYGFTVQTFDGGPRRAGKRIWLIEGEVEAFAAGGAAGLKSYQRSRRAARGWRGPKPAG